MSSWSGKSHGNVLGYRMFVFAIKHFGLGITYFMLRFVALYFFFFSDKKSLKFFFGKILGYGFVKTQLSIYRNYCYLGQVLIDKIAILSSKKKLFTFDFEGEAYLHEMSSAGRGGLLIGAHMGNWEVAGQLLERIDAKVNIVMYDAEHEKIKALLEDVMKDKKLNIIAIKDDSSHLHKIAEAFNNNEFVAMHGDRFLPGTNTVAMNFLGKEALFPTGPLYMASKNKVPVSFVYTLKESSSHYHFFATKPKVFAYPAQLKTRKQDMRAMVQEYVTSLETIVRKFPLQWFNYFPFWEEEKIHNPTTRTNQ